MERFIGDLSWWQETRLKIFGYVKIGDKDITKDYKMALYVIRCPKHGLMVTTPMGHGTLACSECLESQKYQRTSVCNNERIQGVCQC